MKRADGHRHHSSPAAMAGIIRMRAASSAVTAKTTTKTV
jgi:hypothetical protein